MSKRNLPQGDFGKATVNNKKKIERLKVVDDSDRYYGEGVQRLPNNLEIMNKINEIIEVVNKL